MKKPKTAKTTAVKLGSVAADKADLQAAKKAPRNNSKQAQVIEMLRRAEGVTIPQIMNATGWQQHSVHGFLSGAVKKKLGLKVLNEKATNGTRTYWIKAA